MHSKFSVHIDVPSNQINLYANTEFGYSIHEFNVETRDDDVILEIPNKDLFKTLCIVINTKPNLLKEYLITTYKEKQMSN